MPDMGEKTERFVHEAFRFFLIQQNIFRLHMLNSCDTMLFNK